MKLKFIFIIFITYVYVLANAEEISFESDVSYKKNDQQEFTEVKSGEKIELSRGDNAFVTTKQGIGIFILSPEKSDAQIVIPDTSVNQSIFEQLRPTLEKDTSEIVDGLRKTEALVQKRDYNQASQIILALKQKYKNISSILFMNATIRYLLNDKNAAIEDLTKGLEIDPTNESAKKLLSQLKGGT